MVNCKIHNVRFYQPKPNSIDCLSEQKEKYKLALSRADASIEIWNLEFVPFIERIIPSSPSNYSIKGLIWCYNRLFSVGLHGLLVEYDLFKLTKKETYAVTGGAAYCIDTNKKNTHLAVGTEQGYLNIFHVTEEGVVFDKFLDKQEGKIVCLKYDSEGKYIASGSIDAVRIWDVNTGQAIHRMTTGRSEANKPTIVWCIDITNEFVVISGDSRGKLTFWDGKIGAQIESFQSHRADILALTLSENQSTLYCSGVDPNIESYMKIYIKGEQPKWARSLQRKVHDHDVRALILCHNKLYSGGIDGYLACTYHPPKTLLKYPPVLQNTCITLCAGSRYILLRYPNYIEVWTLGESTTSDYLDKSAVIPLLKEPKKLLVLQRTVKSFTEDLMEEGIICSSMSCNGKWIAFSTDTVLRLFSFNYDQDEIPKLHLIKPLPSECGPSVNLIFTPDELELILAVRSGSLLILDLTTNSIKAILETESILNDTITHLITSQCGKYLVAADPESNIAVWKKSETKWSYYCNLPKYNCSPTALSVNPVNLSLMVAYVDHTIVDYSLDHREYNKCSKRIDHKDLKRWTKKAFPIRNITFDRRNENVFIVHDDSNVIVVKKEMKSTETSPKIPKLTHSEISPKNQPDSKSWKYKFNVVKKYKHLVHLGFISNDEMVAVEVNPMWLSEQLPPCLKQNTFGQM